MANIHNISIPQEVLDTVKQKITEINEALKPYVIALTPAERSDLRITSYNVCYTKLLRFTQHSLLFTLYSILNTLNSQLSTQNSKLKTQNYANPLPASLNQLQPVIATKINIVHQLKYFFSLLVIKLKPKAESIMIKGNTG